ncbi:MAG TPA: hypothetical protein VFI93_05250 [Rhizomicrobium sp.]|jgi:hypothetical protein|nr:hypothetical protein [Rhizomicrobium sp.]
MEFKVPPHRAVAAAAVLLLHVLVLIAFLNARITHLVREQIQVLPITVLFPQYAPKPAEESQAPEASFAKPEEVNPKAPTITIAPSTSPEYKGPIGLGQYLFNCSAGQYDRLSEQEWQACLGGQWANQPKDRGFRLGDRAPSPWDADMAERNKAFRPPTKPCPKDRPNANLGLPCFDFSGTHLLGR